MTDEQTERPKRKRATKTAEPTPEAAPPADAAAHPTTQNEEPARADLPATVPGSQHEITALRLHRMTREQIELIKTTIAVGATDAELALFIEVCNATGLNPFKRQIHAVKRWDGRAQREVMAIQTGIDGYRLIAERTGKYLPGPIEFCGPDGVWVETWVATDRPPTAARATVFRRDFLDENGRLVPVRAVAHWRSYAQTTRDGSLTSMWKRMGELMIGKCAEALAIRRAFPDLVSGIYTDEEMSQADREPQTSLAAGTASSGSPYPEHPKPQPKPETAPQQSEPKVVETTAKAEPTPPNAPRNAIDDMTLSVLYGLGKNAAAPVKTYFYETWLPERGYTGKTVGERWTRFVETGAEHAAEACKFLDANKIETPAAPPAPLFADGASKA